MMRTWTREEALGILLEINGGFKAGTCKESDDWYVKKNLTSLREFIVESTNFLDYFEPNFKIRMLYFKLNLANIQICPICKINLLEPVCNENRFRPTCKLELCRKEHNSNNTKKMHQNFSQEQKETKNKKIGIRNSGSYEEKFGKEKSDFLKSEIGKRASARKQKVEEKIKRVETRRRNNSDWHSKETKLKLSKSNKETHLSESFKNKHKETFINARLKQSATMKAKILSGEFTPNSSNWKKSARVKFVIDKQEFSFRSKWEAAYYLTCFYEGQKLQYETIRIPYKYGESENIFIVDFLDDKNQFIIEVRPKSRQMSSIKEIKKFDAAKAWSQENGFKFLIIDEDWFEENWDLVEKHLETFKFETNQHLFIKKPVKCHL